MSTPAPTRGVPVMLDRERRLRYPFGVLREMREKFGEAALTGGMKDENLPEMLLLGLKHEDPTLTVEQVESMVDLENLKEVVQAMTKALGYKPPKEGDPANPPVPQPAPAPAAESASASQ